LDNLEKMTKFCEGYREKLSSYREVKPTPVGKKRTRIISISDLHVPFHREDLIRDIIEEHSGADVLVLNGDLFDNYSLSSFSKSRDIPFAVEYSTVFEIVKLAARNFGKVIIVDGNHDSGRFSRELGKLDEGVKFLIKPSPLQYIANGRDFSPTGEDLGTINLPNVTYAGEKGIGWYHQIGQAIFVHRLRGYKAGPMANAIDIANWFLRKGTEFQCLVSAHSHHVGMVPYYGRLIIDQGALCLPLEYEKNGGCKLTPPDLGYAIVELDARGNVDPETTRPIFLGTYQEQNNG